LIRPSRFAAIDGEVRLQAPADNATCSEP
jgi:hypothetical protein